MFAKAEVCVKSGSLVPSPIRDLQYEGDFTTACFSVVRSALRASHCNHLSKMVGGGKRELIFLLSTWYSYFLQPSLRYQQPLLPHVVQHGNVTLEKTSWSSLDHRRSLPPASPHTVLGKHTLGFDVMRSLPK